MFFLVGFQLVYAQKESQKATTPYTLYKDKIVVYSDLGFSTSPYSIKFKSAVTPVTKLRFKNNLGLVMGIGFSYRWMSLRIGFALSKNFRDHKQYGKTSYFDLGFDFPIKKTYFEFDFRNYKGYSLKNAYHWNHELPTGQKNQIHPEASTLTISLNGWYFHNKDFKMHSLKGKIAHYNREVFTWYLKATVNVHGLSDEGSIIPWQLTDSLNSKTRATVITAFDFGILPGVAYVNRYKNWQYGGMIGFGPVLQSKFYVTDETTRGFLGLAPRYDIRFIAGYNVPRWFVMASTEFDNKSVIFNDLKYKNNSYTIKLTGGYRFDHWKKKKEDKKEKRK